MLVINIVLAYIMQLTIFCCRVVVAITYSLLGKNNIEKIWSAKKIYIFLVWFTVCIVHPKWLSHLSPPFSQQYKTSYLHLSWLSTKFKVITSFKHLNKYPFAISWHLTPAFLFQEFSLKALENLRRMVWVLPWQLNVNTLVLYWTGQTSGEGWRIQHHNFIVHNCFLKNLIYCWSKI